MRLFVTGGTGFLGSHFLREALEDGHDVRALRRSRVARNSNTHGALRWVEAAMDAVPLDALRGCDILVHFAAAGVSPQAATPDELFGVNVIKSLRLWEDALEAGVRRLVICGSCFEYGRAAERYERIPVDAPLEPVTYYGASKAAATMAALALANERRCELAVLRPFTAFGEGQHGSNFWPSLRRAAASGADFPMTAGGQLRDFVPARDVARQFLDALDWTLAAGGPRIANVGSGQPQTLRAFAEMWWSKFAAPGRLRIGAMPYRAGEIMRYVPEL